MVAPPVRPLRHGARPAACREGKVRHRHHEDHSERALCLTVVTKASAAWTAEHLNLAVGQQLGVGQDRLAPTPFT